MGNLRKAYNLREFYEIYPKKKKKPKWKKFREKGEVIAQLKQCSVDWGPKS